jgi:hypothetical protein
MQIQLETNLFPTISIFSPEKLLQDANETLTLFPEKSQKVLEAWEKGKNVYVFKGELYYLYLIEFPFTTKVFDLDDFNEDYAKYLIERS